MELYPYQQYGATWLSERKHALLADEMGVGKTPQAIGAVDILLKDPVLVVCPPIGTINWQREFENFSIYGWDTKIIRSGEDTPSRTGVTICPSSLVGDIRVWQRLVRNKFKVVILDESHNYKNPDARRTMAVYGELIDKKFKGAVSGAEHVFRLSGTPMPNNASELWTTLRSAGSYEGKFESFKDRFCKSFTYNGLDREKIVGNKNVNALKKLLAPITLRRKLEDVMDEMPIVNINNLVVEPNEVDEEVWFPKFFEDRKKKEILVKQAEKLYGIMDSTTKENMIERLSSESRSFPALRKYTGFQKVQTTAEIVAAKLTDPNKRVVIFGIHRDFINYLRQLLKPFSPEVIYGGTKPEKRQKIIDMFDAGTRRCVICNITAANTVIRFKDVDHIYFPESSWVPSDNEQAIFRGLWTGRTKPLFVTYISIPGSTDEKINDALVVKMNMINEVFQ